MKNRLISHPLWRNTQTWWNTLSRREQYLMLSGITMLFIAIVYWGIYQPLKTQNEQSRRNAVTERQLLTWVSQKADNIVSLRNSGCKKSVSTQPLNQLISSSSSRFKIELIRVQPREEMLQVWIKPIPFNQLINWISYLQETYAIEVEFLDISRAEPIGMVEISRLQFKRRD